MTKSPILMMANALTEETIVSGLLVAITQFKADPCEMTRHNLALNCTLFSTKSIIRNEGFAKASERYDVIDTAVRQDDLLNQFKNNGGPENA